MIDINSIALQVKHNCNISDAQYWGYYSPCGLLLRLRDLYRIEHGLAPWEAISHKTVGSWIDEREELWRECETLDFQHIKINSSEYDPFDTRAINDVLVKEGYFYSAGYGNKLKPVFILAELSKHKVKGKYNIFTVNREMARDLSTSPAMIQGHTIIARQETMQMFLWGKYEEMQSRKCAGSLYHAFSEYGINEDAEVRYIEERFSHIVEEELATYIYHELGEASQRRILGTWWKQLLMKLPHSRAEIFIRALKDIMSDTCNSGMLAYITENKRTGSLSFYVSLLSGMRKIIFPGIVSAYSEFRETGDWDVIERARVEGYKRAGDYVRRLKGMFDRGRVSAGEIERELIS